jgi:hypothetical protein
VEILGRPLTLVTLGQHSEQLRHLPSMTEHSHLGFGQRQRRCHKTWFIPASRRLQSPISSVCTGLPARDLRPCSGNVVARFAFRNIPSTTTSRTHHHPITAQPIAFRMVTFPQSLASSERIASVTYVESRSYEGVVPRFPSFRCPVDFTAAEVLFINSSSRSGRHEDSAVTHRKPFYTNQSPNTSSRTARLGQLLMSG